MKSHTFFIFLFLGFQSFAFSQDHDISLRLITSNSKQSEVNRSWFIYQYADSYYEHYSRLGYEIYDKETGAPRFLGKTPSENMVKLGLLSLGAEELYKEYVTNSKQNYFAMIAFDKETPVGAIFYKIVNFPDNTRNLYISAFFVVRNFKRKGIGSLIIEKIEALHKDIDDIYVVQRHQHTSGVSFLTKCGFFPLEEDSHELLKFFSKSFEFNRFLLFKKTKSLNHSSPDTNATTNAAWIFDEFSKNQQDYK